MTSVPKKKSGEKTKMVLSLEIHSLKLFLPDSCEIFLEILRGKDLKKQTDKQEYDPVSPIIPLNLKFSADIKMQKKGKKYKKKTLKIKVVQISTSAPAGSVSIDLSPIPTLKKPIVNREISFATANDQVSSIFLSLSLTPSLKNSLPAVKDVPKLEFAEDVDSDNESVSSRMSFSDAILHPKESEVQSESSSSEEEYKQFSTDRLVVGIPKATMNDVIPNEGSKHLSIVEKEEQAGIRTRKSGNCVNCLIS